MKQRMRQLPAVRLLIESTMAPVRWLPISAVSHGHKMVMGMEADLRRWRI